VTAGETANFLTLKIMQNLQTLIQLGFQKNLHGEYFWRGKKVTFVARLVDYNGPYCFVEIFIVSSKIDDRPMSERRGRHYQSFVKDCCSQGSVERAIKFYDR
jgi:hypothetical protein